MLIYTVRSGDTLASVARKFGVPIQSVIADNQIAHPNRLVAGQLLVIARKEARHTVRPGDTLHEIAGKFGVTIADILGRNPGINNPDAIYPGQIIIIPPGLVRRRDIEVNGYCYTFINPSTLSLTLPYLTYTSVFSYEFTAEGGLLPPGGGEVASAAKNGGVAPLLVLTNIDETGHFSSDHASRLLRSEEAQRRLLAELAVEMRGKGYYGIDIDLEYVRGEDRELYNMFLERAVRFLRPLGYMISSAVAAKSSDSAAGDLYEGQDYAFHGKILDMVLLMTYDWGHRSGEPMAVSPIYKIKETLDYAVSVIPREKILMGMPNYGYDWILPHEPGTLAKTIMLNDALSLAAEHWSEIKYDERSEAPFFNYIDEAGRSRVVWFDDPRSIDKKLALIGDYDIRGAGYWNINNFYNPNWLVLTSMYNVKKII